MRKIVSFALRQPKINAYLRRLYSEVRSAADAVTHPATAVPEATPIDTRRSDQEFSRLTLLVPALSVQHVFGGIATALQVFTAIGESYTNLRIVLTDEAGFTHDKNPAFSGWSIKELDDDDAEGKVIVPAGDRWSKTLPICAGDVFVTTSWWTTSIAARIQAEQQTMFLLPNPQKYIYLIQDYEPGFYPWSARYALAEATYHKAENFLAIFNTSILKDFFQSEGYEFPLATHFEPTLHPQLKIRLPSDFSAKRQKKIIIYGRPGVERNAFPIIVMALKSWIAQANPEGWTIVSAGEAHPPVDLGGGYTLISLGKLSIEGYAAELSSAFIGISLMISPHPSYPPLEMSAFGVQVITNKYKSKDLAQFSPDISTVDFVSPESVASLLGDLAQAYDLPSTPRSLAGDYPELTTYTDSDQDFRWLRAWVDENRL